MADEKKPDAQPQNPFSREIAIGRPHTDAPSKTHTNAPGLQKIAEHNIPVSRTNANKTVQGDPAPVLNPPRPQPPPEPPKEPKREPPKPTVKRERAKGPTSVPGFVIKNTERGFRLIAEWGGDGWLVTVEAYDVTEEVAAPELKGASAAPGFWVWEGWSQDQYGDYLFDGDVLAPYWVATIEESANPPSRYGAPIPEHLLPEETDG